MDDGFEQPPKLRLWRGQMLARLLIGMGDLPPGAFVQRGQLGGQEEELAIRLLASLRREAGRKGADQLVRQKLREIGPVHPSWFGCRQGQLDTKTDWPVEVDHHRIDELSSPSVSGPKRFQTNDQMVQGGVVLGDRRLQHRRPGLRILGRRRLACGPVSVRRAIASDAVLRFGQQVRIEYGRDNGLRAFGEAGRIQLIAGVTAEKREIRSSHD